MKKAAIIAHREIIKQGLDGFYVGNIHDEGQLDCSIQDAEQVGDTCVKAIEQAGEALGFKVPLTGNYKVGLSWADCH